MGEVETYIAERLQEAWEQKLEQLRSALAGLIECHGPLGHWGRTHPPCDNYYAAVQALEDTDPTEAH